MGQYDQGQPSPYQALLEQAASQELAKPRGRWVTDIRENYMLPQTRPQWTPDGRMYMEHDPGIPSRLAELSHAAAQSDAAKNAVDMNRFNTVLGAPAQNTQAGASATQAGAMAADVALKTNPEYQKFSRGQAMLGAALPGTVTRDDLSRVGVLPQSPASLIGVQLGLPEGAAPPAAFADALKQYRIRGGKPMAEGTPEYKAWQSHYGADMAAAMDGEPVGLLDTLRHSTGTADKSGTTRAREMFRRVRDAGKVGVPAPAVPTRKPGVPIPEEKPDEYNYSTTYPLARGGR